MSPQLRHARITTEREYTATNDWKKPASRRCDNCRWPARCREDHLCWQAEKDAVAAERTAPGPHVWTAEDMTAAVHDWVTKHGRPPARDDWEAETDGHPSLKTAIRVWGSWKALLASADQKPLGPWGKVTR